MSYPTCLVRSHYNIDTAGSDLKRGQRRITIAHLAMQPKVVKLDLPYNSMALDAEPPQ